MPKYLKLIFLWLLILVPLLYYFLTITELKKEVSEINAELNFQASLFESIHDIMVGQWSLTGLDFPGDLELLNEERETIKLDSIINEETLIFWFSTNSCGECVKQEVGYLRELQNETNLNIIIIGNFNKFKDLKILVREKYLLNFPIYTISADENPKFKLLETDTVIIFTINSENQMANCHIANVSLPEVSRLFYGHIRKKLRL